MKNKKICPVCKKEIDEHVIDVCRESYQFIIDRIKQEHPDWVEKDGACPKCVDYYKKL